MPGSIPGSGIGMPGRGTLKGGTMTGGNPGIGAAGCGTVWGNDTGRGGRPDVMATVTVGGLTAANAVGRAVGVVVTATDISTTSGAKAGVGRRGEAAVMLGEEAELMAVAGVWELCEVVVLLAAAGMTGDEPGPRLAPPAAAAAAAAWLSISGPSSACWITFTPSGFVQADSRVRAL